MIQQKFFRKRNILVTTVVLIALVLSMFSVTVSAAGGLTMSTVYTGMSAEAGDSVSYPLTFNNTAAGEIVELSVVSAPEGWETYFFGNETIVSSLYVANGTLSGAVNFNVNIPWSASNGVHEITIRAKGRTISSDLTVKLNVTAEDVGESTLDVLYAKQEGDSGSTFSFTAAIRNNTPEEQSYNLVAQVPSGWSIAFKADSVRVAAVTVPARSSQNVTVEITPAAAAEASTYTIPIGASSAKEMLTSELSVVITGTYGMEVSTSNGLLSFDAYANKETTFTMTVTNTGNAPLNNISLRTSVPDGWNISYSQSTIDTLAAGASADIAVSVTPAENALSGDYAIIVEARNSDTNDSVEFRATVKTETVWGITGIALIVVALVGLWFVFRKFGRR